MAASTNKSPVIPDPSSLSMPASTADEPPPPREISRAETAAYATALLVNIVDQMGPQFVSPVLVTYGTQIGATAITVSLFQTARGISAMLSNIWMPMLSDRCGRKWVAFLSVCGVSLGYLLQASADQFVHEGTQPVNWGPACICFIIGRFVTGFFSGMQPVLQAYITELSGPEADLITQRLVVVQVAANVGGIAVSPLSGFLAGALGLQVPFYVVTIIGVISVLVVPIYFKEVEDIRTDLSPDPGGVSMQQPKKSAGSSSAREPFVGQPETAGNPFFDKVIMLMFVAYISLMVMINGITVFLTPILFQQQSFAIPGGPWEPGFDGDLEPFRRNVSSNIGYVNIPIGALQVIVAILFFVPVTKKFGEVPTLVVMGLIGTVSFPVVGYCQTVWQVAIIFGVLGMSFGFLTPALGPVAARYGRAVYPKQMALVQGIPLVGMQFSNAFAQNVLALVVGPIDDPVEGPPLDRANLLMRIRYAYFVVAAFACLFTISFAGAASLSTQRINALRLAGGVVPDDDDDEPILFRSVSDSRVAVPVGTPVLKRALSGSRPRPGGSTEASRSPEALDVSLQEPNHGS